MTLLSYQVFMAVVEQESFQKAAQVLQLTPSAISHAVAGMESELGFPLVYPQQAGRISDKLWKGTVSLHKKCTEQR